MNMEKKEKGLVQKTTKEGYRLGLVPSTVVSGFDNIRRVKVIKNLMLRSYSKNRFEPG